MPINKFIKCLLYLQANFLFSVCYSILNLLIRVNRYADKSGYSLFSAYKRLSNLGNFIAKLLKNVNVTK